MVGFSLKNRARLYAVSAGVLVFLSATIESPISTVRFAWALLLAVLCAGLGWALAVRALAAALDVATGRLNQASDGDLHSPIEPDLRRAAPQLADAIERLFRQIDANTEKIRMLAMFDAVTGLPNRTHFRRSCDRVLAELAPDQAAALFFVDLDRFKAVNDTLGHASGDQLLGMVAERLIGVAAHFTVDAHRHPPLIGRLSGDEFTLFFPETTGPAHADRIAAAIIHALSEPFEVMGREASVGASVGIALRPEHGTTLHALMRAADLAMYHAKAQGRDRAEHYTEALASEVAGRKRLERELQDAIGQNQFALVFQPQIAANDGRLVAAEALLRWHHPDGEVRLPGSFIDQAEQSGVIIEIGEWIVTNLAETIARWGRLGIRQRMAVNITPRQLHHAAFFHKLREAMHEAGAPAMLLELEINETLAMNCSPDVLDAIEALRADGASVAIDDFGTGYSNLARLRNLPVDRVKLDRSVIAQVVDDTEARTIAQAVINLIHGLNCEAVAEGIEAGAQAEVLRVIGCDILQGYAVAEPMSEPAFLAWARDSATVTRRAG